MIILDAAGDKIEVVLNSPATTSQLRTYSCWRDVTTSAYTPGKNVVATNNTTDVTMVAAPAASTQRVVDYLSVFNNDTVAATLTIKFDNGTIEPILWKGTLAVNEKVEYVEGAGWRVLNTQGVPKGIGADGAAGAAGINGALTVSSVEIDFGLTPVSEAVIIVTDAAITATHNIIANISGEASSNADADENEMDSIVVAAAAGSGKFTAYLRAIPGPVSGKRVLNYQYS